ncbi:MAG: periplasmic binding protein [Spirochaetes bacterium]|nr:MAG: periplasmic binding protein [Spirochaetota bacterium]
MKPIYAAFFFLAFAVSAFAQNRLVLGGRAVIMVADAVYLFPGAGEKVIAIAGADQGLGSFLSVIDPGYINKPVLDRNAGVEAYAALKPDTIILKSTMKKSLGPNLDALGLRQLYVDLETPEDYYRDLRRLGSFLGAQGRGEEIVGYYQEKVRSVQRTVRIQGQVEGQGQNPQSLPKVLLVQGGSSVQGAFEAPPASWMQTKLVEMAGGTPVWTKANPGAGWASINAEQIVAWNPDYVFVVDYRSDSRLAARAFAAQPALGGVEAVKKGRVFGFPQDYYSWDQPDVRWILGLEWLARKLYPQEFAGSSMMDSAQEFFRFMYRMDKNTFDQAILPRLAGDF